MSKSIHDFSIEGLRSGLINFADYKGKKILLVNVASACGLTPQYQQLQELYNNFSDRVVVVGCPANNFGAQEPGTDEQIEEFCSLNYGVSFPMSRKISVKGEDIHPLYRFVVETSDTEPNWNFHKYLFDEEGQLQKVFAPTIQPLDENLLQELGIRLQ